MNNPDETLSGPFARSPEAARPETVSILAVDDNRENLLTLAAVLQDPGITFVQARSGEESLRLLLDRDFAVVLLDVRMPEMDGFELATLIRGRERSAQTPIIFMT